MAISAVQWHHQRRVRILARHPEVGSLQGTYPPSRLFILLLVGVDVALAWALRDSTWVLTVALAFTVGAAIAHALGVLIHECTHNLVTRGTRANKLWMIVANVPLLAPAAIGFRGLHLLHHRFLGEVDGRDTQAPSRGEIAFTGNSSIRKLASFTFGRFFYKGRPANRVPVDGFLVLNWGVQAVACVVLAWLAGVQGLSFLFLSGLLAFGPHPFGARRLSEHFAMRPEQPTVSYYGPLNAVSFDVGYHVEHHDFPGVPWPRMRALRRIAREEYDHLFAFRSWTRLLLAHFFDRRYRVDHYAGFGVVLEGSVAARADVPSDARAVTVGAQSTAETGSPSAEPTRARAARRRSAPSPGPRA